MAELLLVVGLPGAGKTTCARALAADRDSVRIAARWPTSRTPR